MKATEKQAVQGAHNASVTLLHGEGATILGGTAYFRRQTCGPRTVWVVQCLRSLRLCFALGLGPVSPRVRQEVRDWRLALFGLGAVPGEKQLPEGQARKVQGTLI